MQTSASVFKVLYTCFLSIECHKDEQKINIRVEPGLSLSYHSVGWRYSEAVSLVGYLAS